VIQQLSASAADPPLGNPILPWTPKGRSLRLDSKILDRLTDPFREYGVVVVDEKSWSKFFRERLAELLYYPGRCRMGGHAKVDDFPSSVADHEPGVQQAEPNSGDDDEVHRGDAVFVIAKKRLPALPLVVVPISLR
jgi:hypothetical protein